MATQYKNLGNFRAYKKRIFEYLSAEIVKLPRFFEYQPILNNTTSGGITQQTIRQGRVTRGRKIDEPLLIFDNALSQNREDDNIIEHIAYSLDNYEPDAIHLKVGLFVYTPGNPGLSGPYFTDNADTYNSEIQNILETSPIGSIGYFPFVRIANTNDVLVAPKSINNIFNILEQTALNQSETFMTLDEFKSMLSAKGFSLTQEHNISDNTGQYLPVGIKRRKVSKKILRETSETAITEIVPQTEAYRVLEFFRQWEKIQNIVPSGLEFITGGTFINNGDFSGGVGPGLVANIFETTPPGTFAPSPPDGEFGPVADINLNSAILSAFELIFAPFPNSPWNPVNIEAVKQSMLIENIENPGFSPYVLSSTRNSPARYDVIVENLEFTPDIPYTISAWVAEQENFNQNNFYNLNKENIFFYRIVAYSPGSGGQEFILKDYPEKSTTSTLSEILDGTETRTGMKGEVAENWQGEELLWQRIKHTFTYSNTDIDGNEIDINNFPNGVKVRLEWLLSYQNSVPSVFESAGALNSPIEGLSSLDEGTGIGWFFPGPNLFTNANFAKQYYTGIRVNVGDEIGSANKIQLSNPPQRTISTLLNDCIELLTPLGKGVPVYSSAQLNSLLRAQNASTQILRLIDEIRNSLIQSITNLTDQFSIVIPQLVGTLTADPESDNPVTNEEAAALAGEAVNAALSGSNLPGDITSLINQFDSIYGSLAVNDAQLFDYSVQPNDVSPYIQMLVGNDEDKNIPFSDPISSRYTLMHEHFLNGDYYADMGDDNFLEKQLPEFATRPTVGDAMSWNAFGHQMQQYMPSDNSQLKHGWMGTDINAAEQSDGVNAPIIPYIFEARESQTPIGAMYASEMYEYNTMNNRIFRGGPLSADPNPQDDTYDYHNYSDRYFMDYFENPDSYPGYTYGPYAAINSPRGDFGPNPIFRMQKIIEAFQERMNPNIQNAVGVNMEKQFEFMDGQSGFINSNFEPLKEYCYVVGRGREWMFMVYPDRAHQSADIFAANQFIDGTDNDLKLLYEQAAQSDNYIADLMYEYLNQQDGYGFANINNHPPPQPGDYNYPATHYTHNTDENNLFPLGFNSMGPNSAKDYYRGLFSYLGGNTLNPNISNPGDYWAYQRFYEPHWEWNPMLNKFVFRFAQPVLGTTVKAVGSQVGNLNSDLHPLNGYGGRYGIDPVEPGKIATDYVGERKYKFKTMKFFTEGQ